MRDCIVRRGTHGIVTRAYSVVTGNFVTRMSVAGIFVTATSEVSENQLSYVLGDGARAINSYDGGNRVHDNGMVDCTAGLALFGDQNAAYRNAFQNVGTEFETAPLPADLRGPMITRGNVATATASRAWSSAPTPAPATSRTSCTRTSACCTLPRPCSLWSR